MQTYYAYLLRCADGTFYAGICTDTERRVSEHNTSSKGARYTSSRRPVRLAYRECCDGRSAALKRERWLRTLNRSQKEALSADWLSTTGP